MTRSVMEYPMAYGWATLMIVVVSGALFSLICLGKMPEKKAKRLCSLIYY